MIAALLLALSFDPTNLEDVAREALSKSARCSQGVRECGGVIYRKPDGSYVASEPAVGVTYGVDMGQFYFGNTLPIAADYHVHICGPHNRRFANYFSPADGMVNEGFHTIGYMLSLCDHNIRRFDPQELPREVMVIQFHSGKELEMPIGHVVGWLP